MEILTPSSNLPGIEHMICRLHKLRQTFIGEQICGSIFEKQLSNCLFQVFVAYEEGQLLIKTLLLRGVRQYTVLCQLF